MSAPTRGTTAGRAYLDLRNLARDNQLGRLRLIVEEPSGL